MPRKKIDGVIEAVRYDPAGRIQWVRAYERRGAAWSDHLLLDRKQLLERLSQGKRFITGQRQRLLASTFITGKSVQAIGDPGKQVLATRPDASRDLLEDVPFL